MPLLSKRKIRVLTVAAAAILDDYSRKVIAAHADFSLPAQGVVDVLELIALNRPYPEQIRVDNGPVFLADKFKQWCENKAISIHGAPQNMVLPRSSTIRSGMCSSTLSPQNILVSIPACKRVGARCLKQLLNPSVIDGGAFSNFKEQEQIVFNERNF